MTHLIAIRYTTDCLKTDCLLECLSDQFDACLKLLRSLNPRQVCAVLELMQKSCFKLMVYSENNESYAMDIHCQYRNSLSHLRQEARSFWVYLSKYNYGNKYSTQKTLSVQNILPSLLKLNYQPMHHNMKSKFFEGSLH